MSPAARRALWSLLGLVLLAAMASPFLLERRERGGARRARPAPPVLVTLPPFSLLEARGVPVGNSTLLGAPFVADFIFTRCRSICPMLTERMAALRRELPPSVRTVSITVDPEHDTPAELTAYVALHHLPGRADASWLFLTGERAAIYALIRQGFLLPVDENPADAAMPVMHSNRFALVDSRGRLRGAYDAFDAEAIANLKLDLAALARED